LFILHQYSASKPTLENWKANFAVTSLLEESPGPPNSTSSGPLSTPACTKGGDDYDPTNVFVPAVDLHVVDTGSFKINPKPGEFTAGDRDLD
jgi:hypothetical protein